MRGSRQASGRASWPEPRTIRAGEWRVAAAPADLDDRRVEITGPGRAEDDDQRPQLGGARVFMADLEDALSPGWANVVGGQAAIRDAVRRELAFETPTRRYRLGERHGHAPRPPARLAPRGASSPRGRRPVSASLFDAGLYLFHGAAEALARGSGPYLYLPKLESPPRGAAVERRVPPCPGGAGRPARAGPGDGPDRDHPRRVRDGRDPVRAARARCRSQRRALGLPVQHHQAVPRATRRSCCPTGAR